MKRALAIPLGLSLFGLAVASFVISRPAGKVSAAATPVAAAGVSTFEVAQNDDYLPPLLGIFDDQDLLEPTAMSEVAGTNFERPNLLPLEILRQAAWPAVQASDLLTVGFDNPLTMPVIPTPKIVLPESQSSLLLIPPQLDTQSTSGYQAAPAAASTTPTAASTTSRLSDNLIRPKPLSVETPLARIQPTEPPLAGSQAASVQSTPNPTAHPAPTTATTHGAPAQSILVRDLAEFTGCGCEPRLGTCCCNRNRFFGRQDCCCANEMPLCCQSFATCCQASCGCQVVEVSSCCSEEGRWHPFARLRNFFRGERKGGCGCFDDNCFDCGCNSGRKPLFNRIRGIFRKPGKEDGLFVESCGCGSVRTGCYGQ